jgi:predicted HAD superfamily Cof-like phosphohydrolase
MIKDVSYFMKASGQSVGELNVLQAELYNELVLEEHKEWKDATKPVDDLDAIVDQIWVLIGLALSAGYDISGAWDEVARSNFSKINKDTGTVEKRADGKVLKPTGWKAPNLVPYI